jgi:hypothetical protein
VGDVGFNRHAFPCVEGPKILLYALNILKFKIKFWDFKQF